MLHLLKKLFWKMTVHSRVRVETLIVAMLMVSVILVPMLAPMLSSAPIGGAGMLTLAITPFIGVAYALILVLVTVTTISNGSPMRSLVILTLLTLCFGAYPFYTMISTPILALLVTSLLMLTVAGAMFSAYKWTRGKNIIWQNPFRTLIHRLQLFETRHATRHWMTYLAEHHTWLKAPQLGA
jgi:hypothetical protein